MGKRVGYIRVSSVDQNTARQLADIKLDRIFEDKASGKSANRPALQEALAYLREGDTFIVHSMDRLARNLDDLRKIVFSLVERGVTVEFVKESMKYSPNSANPMSTLLLSVMGAFAEFERSIIKERQREGIMIARQNNLFGGGKEVFTDEHILNMIHRIENGEPLSRVANSIGYLGIRRANGSLVTNIARCTLSSRRSQYVNAHPEIVNVYPRLKIFLKSATTGKKEEVHDRADQKDS